MAGARFVLQEQYERTSSSGSYEELDVPRASGLLVRTLQDDRRIERFTGECDYRSAVEQAERFLGKALGSFGAQEDSAPRLQRALFRGSHYDGLVQALVEAVQQPLPEGSDRLAGALAVICEEMENDPRILAFLRELPAGCGTPSESPEEEEDYQGEDSESYVDEDYPDEDDSCCSVEYSENPLVNHLSPDDGINIHSLEELDLEPNVVSQVQNAWEALNKAAAGREAVGDMIYNALFEGAPSLEALFTTPRAVQVLKFVDGISNFVAAVGEPPRLKDTAEALGFVHLNIDVTAPRVALFRDAILELLTVELGAGFSDVAREGWRDLLNYIGGAMIYVRAHYATRLNLLVHSWTLANDRTANQKPPEDGDDDEDDAELSPKSPRKERRWTVQRPGWPDKKGSDGVSNASASPKGNSRRTLNSRAVPTTYNDMFGVNATVMGYGKSTWLKEVLRSFDNIVRNAANPARLHEECDIVALRISKSIAGPVNLSEYKACMLAALRSLLPKLWDSSYEVAWTWLWENVERLLKGILQKPPVWEKALVAFMCSLEDAQKRDIRERIYDKFFELAPAGQDYFTQSNTRLHFIAQRIMEMTCELFRDPWQMVEEISVLGLRHVGFGVPTELFGPFVTASIQVVSTATADKKALEAYCWSLNLISKILVRTIMEGSTIVMKAINANSARMLRKAVSCAPRKSRAEWLLNIQVGTHQISPLEWAIQSGNLEAADVAIKDLLTLRADRDRYYFGVDELFDRHPEIVQRLCDEAPSLLPTLLEGLVWRSLQTKNGTRRVNYYIKHLIVNKDGGLSDALRSLAASGDQTIISHPVIVLVSDTLWTGVIRRQFVLSKIGLLLSILAFMLSQAILPKVESGGDLAIRTTIFVGRIVNYVYGLGRLLISHFKHVYRGYTTGDTFRVWGFLLPRYLHDPFMVLSFVLAVLFVLMCAREPMFYCKGPGVDWPTESCPQAKEFEYQYALCSMLAMVIHWLLLVDMAAFSTKLQAFLLVCRHVMSELGRFLVAMLFLLATFSSAITCLRHSVEEFSDLFSSAKCLTAITLGLFEGDYREMTHEPALLIPVFLFVTVSTILLINLLIAQLNCSYDYVYQDMVGNARLARAQLIVEMLASCAPERWNRFVSSLHLDQPLEFDEGDVGPPGGIQVKEPASLHPVVADSIFRFAGSCSPDMQWPEVAEEEDRFERVERLMQAAYKRMMKVNRGRTNESRASSALSSSGSNSDKASEEQYPSLGEHEEEDSNDGVSSV